MLKDKLKHEKYVVSAGLYVKCWWPCIVLYDYTNDVQYVTDGLSGLSSPFFLYLIVSRGVARGLGSQGAWLFLVRFMKKCNKKLL